MAIRTSKIASVADDLAVPAAIQPTDLNLEVIPSVPADGDLRTERTGTSPTRYLRLYVYDSGAWQLLSERVI